MSIKDLVKNIKDQAPKWNGKKCKDSCNCIEIAEYFNAGNPVKEYECRKPDSNAVEATLKKEGAELTDENLQARFQKLKKKFHG